MINIDLEKKTIDLELAESDFQARMAALPHFSSSVESRWLRRYAKLVTSASTGAVLED
jgi:dihydroxy-acid dehydratase